MYHTTKKKRPATFLYELLQVPIERLASGQAAQTIQINKGVFDAGKLEGVDFDFIRFTLGGVDVSQLG